MSSDPLFEPQMVRVCWRDTGLQFPQEWQHVEDYVAKLKGTWMHAETVGYRMYQDSDVMLVGLSYDPQNETYYGVQAIDMKAVERIDHLKAGGAVLM